MRDFVFTALHRQNTAPAASQSQEYLDSVYEQVKQDFLHKRSLVTKPTAIMKVRAKASVETITQPEPEIDLSWLDTLPEILDEAEEYDYTEEEPEQVFVLPEDDDVVKYVDMTYLQKPDAPTVAEPEPEDRVSNLFMEKPVTPVLELKTPAEEEPIVDPEPEWPMWWETEEEPAEALSYNLAAHKKRAALDKEAEMKAQAEAEALRVVREEEESIQRQWELEAKAQEEMHYHNVKMAKLASNLAGQSTPVGETGDAIQDTPSELLTAPSGHETDLTYATPQGQDNVAHTSSHSLEAEEPDIDEVVGMFLFKHKPELFEPEPEVVEAEEEAEPEVVAEEEIASVSLPSFKPEVPVFEAAEDEAGDFAPPLTTEPETEDASIMNDGLELDQVNEGVMLPSFKPDLIADVAEETFVEVDSEVEAEEIRVSSPLPSFRPSAFEAAMEEIADLSPVVVTEVEEPTVEEIFSAPLPSIRPDVFVAAETVVEETEEDEVEEESAVLLPSYRPEIATIVVEPEPAEETFGETSPESDADGDLSVSSFLDAVAEEELEVEDEADEEEVPIADTPDLDVYVHTPDAIVQQGAEEAEQLIQRLATRKGVLFANKTINAGKITSDKYVSSLMKRKPMQNQALGGSALFQEFLDKLT